MKKNKKPDDNPQKKSKKIPYSVQGIMGYIFAIVMIGIITYRIMGLWQAQIAVYPMVSQTMDAVTGMASVKSMLQNGWIYENPYLGAPDGVKNYDAMTMELLLNFMQQIMVWITGNWILSYNLTYLLGYYLVGITALYALRRLKIRDAVAVPSAVIYTFLPYHQLRGLGHMYLGLYFMVPISVLFMYRLMNGELIFQKGEKGWFTAKNLLRVAALVCMSLTGIYYTFFTCFFLCVIILHALLNDRDRHQIKQAFISLGIVLGTILLSSVPNFVYWHKYGKSNALSLKGPEGAELYALKIIQLILPRPGHRLTLFDKVNHFYQVVFPLVNGDNITSSLGIFMAAGFVLLCLVLFIGKRVPEKSNLRIGSVLNAAALLYGTVGGFAVILAFFTGALRCYNRFSVYIGMFAVIAMDTMLTGLMNRWFENRWWKRVLFFAGMIVIMQCAVYDQTIPENPDKYNVYAQEYESDESFVKAIEQMEASGAMIYQMPYMKYPENGAINDMPDYAHMSAYLHSDTLHWSYGAASGRETDQWMNSLCEMNFKDQLKEIRAAGFAGVYIDWRAYLPDERTEIEKIFSEEITAEPIVNIEGTKAYYSFQ